MVYMADEHDKAVERLHEAERAHERLTDRDEAPESTSTELSNETELRGAREEIEARERWLAWVDSDGEGGRQSTPALEDLRAR
jgi:hypothetical protein